MLPLSNQAKLLHTLGNLAFYNDMGIEYARQTPTQVESERAAGLAKVREFVAAIGAESLPAEFLQAVASGEIATDFTGRYIDVLRAHFARRVAP